MKSLLAPFILLDKAFQKLVDNLAFFLMRRFGQDKPGVRHFFFSALTGCIIIAAAKQWPSGDPESRASSIIVILVFTVLGYFILRHERSLTPGIRSQLDEVTTKDTRIGIFIRLFLWVRAISTLIYISLVVSGHLPQRIKNPYTAFEIVVAVITILSMMAIVYITDTPDEPPVKKTVLIPVQQ